MVKKRLYRAQEQESMIAGVCAGLGDYFDLDPTLIRILWVIITIFSFGTGILAYILAWIIIPRQPEIILKINNPRKVKSKKTRPNKKTNK